MSLFGQFHNLSLAAGAHHNVGAAHLPGLFRLHLAVAAADDQSGLGIDFLAAAGGIAGFFVAEGGDSAGVDDIHMGKFVKGNDGVSPLFKQSLQSLGLKLVGFAAQGVKCDFHNSPSKGDQGLICHLTAL